MGPLTAEARQYVHTSPVGMVTKGHTTGKRRMTVDLSSPTGCSMNDGISTDMCPLKYASLDDALKLISQLGPGMQLVKMDLKDAYRMVPVHPDDQHLLAISWEGATYVDRSLPFGLRSAPKLFTAVADAIAWILFDRGISFLLHYLDDFLFFGAPQSCEAAVASQQALAVFEELGVPIATYKSEGPSSRVTFLGTCISIVTEVFQVRLPQEKLTQIRDFIREWRGKRACTRKEMESLLGHLSHATMVIRPGRLFLRQLFALLPMAPKPHHHIPLSLAVWEDFQRWDFFMRFWNGISLFPPAPPSVDVYSDKAWRKQF